MRCRGGGGVAPYERINHVGWPDLCELGDFIQAGGLGVLNGLGLLGGGGKIIFDFVPDLDNYNLNSLGSQIL